jgi:probable HAF family extracellular repeat protein
MLLGTKGFPNAINNRDEITGFYGAGDDAAFFYVKGTTIMIAPSPSVGSDLNNRGTVVGGFKNNHAFKWSNGKLTDLDPLLGGQGSFASAINSRGEIVGNSTALGGFLLKPTGRVIPLGTLGGSFTYPAGINVYGEVVGGSALADGTEHAFMWADGRMADLGTLPGTTTSFALGLNDAGQIVGGTVDAAYNQTAFIWNGAMHDLNTLIAPTDPSFGVVHLTQAYGVNHDGQIVVVGNYTAGSPHQGELTTLILDPVLRSAARPAEP